MADARPDPSTKPKRFRLSLVNAAEDVPRLVRAYGRACMGEFALVLRPREQRGVLVLMTKKEGARVWTAGDGDAPRIPSDILAPEEAVQRVKAEQKGLPKAGPITLRGQWSGWLFCDEGAPRVELSRKLAAYGVLTLSSVAGQGWTWKVARTEKWFSKPGADEGSAPTLLAAIEAGLRRAMGLLGEACSVRDSSRRAAYDSGYAAEHPVKAAREGKDPTDRLEAKVPRTPKAKAGSPWRHYAHDDEAPEADPIDRPSRAVLAKVKAGGLRHEVGAGTFLGRTVEVFDGFPAGSLVFREAEDNAGFYLHAPVEEAGRKVGARKASGKLARKESVASVAVPAGEVDAAKDKALLDAFSRAIAAAMDGTN